MQYSKNSLNPFFARCPAFYINALLFASSAPKYGREIVKWLLLAAPREFHPRQDFHRLPPLSATAHGVILRFNARTVAGQEYHCWSLLVMADTEYHSVFVMCVSRSPAYTGSWRTHHSSSQ